MRKVVIWLVGGLGLAACGGGDGDAGGAGPVIGKQVLYVARDEGVDREGVYLVDTGVPAQARRVSPAAGRFDTVPVLEVSGDGRWFAYVRESTDARRQALFMHQRLRPGAVREVALPDLVFAEAAVALGADRLVLHTVRQAGASDWRVFIEVYALDTGRRLGQWEMGTWGTVSDVVDGVPGGTAVFVSAQDGIHRIDLAPDGTARMRMLLGKQASHWFRYPVLSDDGQWLSVVLEDPEARTYQVLGLRTDGSQVLEVGEPVEGSVAHIQPAFVSDGVLVAALTSWDGSGGRIWRAPLVEPVVVQELRPVDLHGVSSGHLRSLPGTDELLMVHQQGVEPDVGPEAYGLYRVHGDGRPPTLLVELPERSTHILGLSADGQRAILSTRSDQDGEHRIESASITTPGDMVTVAERFPSGGQPRSAILCPDGISLIISEYRQFPPGFGGVPEAFPWLSELQVGRVDTAGTSRATPGYRERHGVSTFLCLP